MTPISVMSIVLMKRQLERKHLVYCCWIETDVIDMNEGQTNRRTANAICEGPKTNKLKGVELGYSKVCPFP
jgi:hypothetical protein